MGGALAPAAAGEPVGFSLSGVFRGGARKGGAPDRDHDLGDGLMSPSRLSSAATARLRTRSANTRLRRAFVAPSPQRKIFAGTEWSLSLQVRRTKFWAPTASALEP